MKKKTTMASLTVNARISPRGGLDVLSRSEVSRLRDASAGGLHELLRRCALAVLTSGSAVRRSARRAGALSRLRHPGAAAGSRHQARLSQCAGQAFVDGQIIRGVAELLFAVVRDIAYVAIEIQDPASST
jgi:hypothetical protein